MSMNSAFVLVFVAVALLAGPAAAQENPPYSFTAHPSQDGRCQGDTGIGDLDRSEKACLEQLTGIAAREGTEGRA